MKKLILSAAAISGFSFAGFAQGLITFDGSQNTSISPNATTSGRVFFNYEYLHPAPGSPGGYTALDTFQDINAELLYSSSPNGVFAPVVTLLLSSSSQASSPALGQISSAAGDINNFDNGTLFDTSGNAYQFSGIQAGTTLYFEVAGWLGNYNSLAAAQAGVAPFGITGIFSETLSSAVVPPLANINNMPALNIGFVEIIPEPTSLTMAGIGIGSMLIFACRSRIRRE